MTPQKNLDKENLAATDLMFLILAPFEIVELLSASVTIRTIFDGYVLN